MKVRIRIDKVVALRAGKNRYGYAVVEVDAERLTPRQREVLAGCPSTDRIPPEADFYLDVYLWRSRYDALRATITEADVETVVRLLEAVSEIDERIEAAEAAERMAKAAREEAALAEWAALPLDERVERRADCVWVATNPHVPAGDCPAYLEAKDECVRRNAQDEARRRAEAAEREATKAAGVAILRDWATANGSELLRARIGGGYEWIGLAEREYAVSRIGPLASEVASPFEECESIDVEDRTTPTLGEIEALRRVRLEVGDAATAKLVWVRYTEDDECSDEPDVVSRCEVKVTVTCPTGREIDFFHCADEVLDKLVHVVSTHGG